MTPWDVIQQLYDSEINAGLGLQADNDNGIAVWIGGPEGTPGNHIRSQRTFGRGEFGDIAICLDDEVRRLFPDSDYAKARRH